MFERRRRLLTCAEDTQLRTQRQFIDGAEVLDRNRDRRGPRPLCQVAAAYVNAVLVEAREVAVVVSDALKQRRDWKIDEPES